MQDTCLALITRPQSWWRTTSTAGGFRTKRSLAEVLTATVLTVCSWRPSKNTTSSPPLMNRPVPSCKPPGGLPWIKNWTGFLSAKGFLGVSVTWSSAAL